MDSDRWLCKHDWVGDDYCQYCRVEQLEAAVSAVDALISDSEGVAGLHLNGDVAPWEELRTGGRFEEWLIEFDAAFPLDQPR